MESDRSLRAPGWQLHRRVLSKQIFYDVSSHVGQAEIAAAVAVGQLSVVDTQLMQDGRVNIVYMNGILSRLEARVVGGPRKLSLL